MFHSCPASHWFHGLDSCKCKRSKVKELDIGESFDSVEGTMVLQNLKNDKVFIYNKQRSKVRYTPESTFKVANALIGLQTKAVSDEYEVKRWDGVIRNLKIGTGIIRWLQP